MATPLTAARQAAPGRLVAGLASAIVLAAACAAPAQSFQQISAADAYGRGVNAYFHGGAATADAYLTEALEQNPRDVRAYYYRGLARLRMGLREAAYDDFRVGAAIEASVGGQPTEVGRALERVQGDRRLIIERIRREARTARVEERDAQRVVNARRDSGQQQRVLRSGYRLPMEALAVAGSPNELTELAQTEAPSAPDPFVDDPGQTAGVEVPEAARGAMSVQGLGAALGRVLSRTTGVTPDALQQVAGPGGFAQPRVVPMTPSPGGQAAAPAAGEQNPFAAGAENPFGGASGDPFGGGQQDPFGGSGGEGDDPFGGGEDPFSGGGENPFGEGQENPFGGP